VERGGGGREEEDNKSNASTILGVLRRGSSVPLYVFLLEALSQEDHRARCAQPVRIHATYTHNRKRTHVEAWTRTRRDGCTRPSSIVHRCLHSRARRAYESFSTSLSSSVARRFSRAHQPEDASQMLHLASSTQRPCFFLTPPPLFPPPCCHALVPALGCGSACLSVIVSF